MACCIDHLAGQAWHSAQCIAGPEFVLHFRRWYRKEFDDKGHIAQAFSADVRPSSDSVLHFCCGFSYDESKKTLSPAYEKGAAKR